MCKPKEWSAPQASCLYLIRGSEFSISILGSGRPPIYRPSISNWIRIVSHRILVIDDIVMAMLGDNCRSRRCYWAMRFVARIIFLIITG